MKTGDRIRLINSRGAEDYGLEEGDEGMANSVISLPEGRVVFFMPEGGREQFVMSCDRFEVVGEYVGTDLPEMKQ